MTYSDLIYFNGAFRERESISPQLYSPGFLLNIGVFETIRVYNGVPFRLGEHLDRLLRGTEFLGLLGVSSKKQFFDGVLELIELDNVSNAYLRITCFKDGENTSELMISAPYNGYDPELYERGMRLTVSGFKKNESSPIYRHKTSSMLENYLAHEEAKRLGCDTALLINTRGNISEAAWANIFFVNSGRLITPRIEDGALPGITRQVVIDLARDLGISVEEASVHIDTLSEADEIFLTNSLMEVMPVTAISGLSKFSEPEEAKGAGTTDKSDRIDLPISCSSAGITAKLRNSYKKALSV